MFLIITVDIFIKYPLDQTQEGNEAMLMGLSSQISQSAAFRIILDTQQRAR